MDIKDLFNKLYFVSKESDVKQVLEQYSKDTSLNWHPYGDNESFFGVIENQQASAIPALVEKLTNSIDAILMKKCLEAKIDPKSLEAPQGVDEAVSLFFPSASNWDLSQARQLQSEDIQILAHGSYKDRNKDTSLVIYDNGEGQHPENFSNTFLSLLKGNKNEIHFVQGKYNMGGSGAIVFCGKQRYQLVASKRYDDTGDFGFTLIRKHPLSNSERKTKKNTWYEYLTINNKIPSFKLSESGIDLNLYNRNFTTGTIIKLYSYNLPTGSRSVISRDLNQSINEYLFQPALPIYTIDTEERYPKDRNLQRDLFGLRYRLETDSNKYISERFSEEINDSTIGTYKVTVYVFNHRIEEKSIKDSKSAIRREFFKNNMSVVFSLNGQVHGNYTSEFITRSLKFNLLKDYLLIHVDCTNLDMDFRGELFMASRDRLKNGEESAILRKKLSTYLKKKGGRLYDIYSKRKQDLAANTGSTSSLLKDFSENLPFDSDLMKLINHTFDLKEKSGEQQKKKRKNIPSQTKGKDSQPFSPKRFPTSFKIDVKSKKDTDTMPMVQIPLNGDRTIKFSTDVEDQYFDRADENGELQIAILKPQSNNSTGGDKAGEPKDIQSILDVNKSSPNKGTIRINMNPSKEAKVGDQFIVKAKLTSPENDLEQIFMVKILDKQKKQKQKPQQVDQPGQLGLPKLVEVYEKKTDENTSWEDISYIDFDYGNVMYPLIEEDKLESIFINMDSTIIKNYMSKLRNENELEVSKRRYLSSVYFHTLFLYMINKNKGIKITSPANNEEKSEEIELSEYLTKIFDSSYTEFLMNFEVSALMESLSD